MPVFYSTKVNILVNKVNSPVKNEVSSPKKVTLPLAATNSSSVAIALAVIGPFL